MWNQQEKQQLGKDIAPTTALDMRFCSTAGEEFSESGAVEFYSHGFRECRGRSREAPQPEQSFVQHMHSQLPCPVHTKKTEKQETSQTLHNPVSSRNTHNTSHTSPALQGNLSDRSQLFCWLGAGRRSDSNTEQDPGALQLLLCWLSCAAVSTPGSGQRWCHPSSSAGSPR